MAYGLADEDDGFPRCRHFDLRALAERGAEIDQTFEGRFPLSHYAATAEQGGCAIFDHSIRRTGTR